MRFRWTVFGREITTLEFGENDELSEIIAALTEKEVSGGSGHNFERDSSPADPNDRYRWDDKFGFGRGSC